MKFWELASILREEHDLIRKAAASRPEWNYIAFWLNDLQQLCDRQDREELDALVPVPLVRAALRRSKVKFYLSWRRVLRSRRHSFFDTKLSALRAFERFGGSAMEEALEHGSVRC